MKRICLILVSLVLTTSVFTQSPSKMSYQAVVRDLNSNLITNQAVGIKISILQGSVSGSSVYEEIFNPNPITNSNGLVSVEIGGGVPISGNFSAIDWSAGPYFIKTETDPTGQTNYTIVGVSQLLSVPYALHSKSAEIITGNITELDPIFGASPSYSIVNEDITNWNTANIHSTSTTGTVHGSTTVGENLLRFANPSAVSFVRINANNSITALNASDFRTAIGAGTGNGTITSIGTGNGITGGTITTTGTLGLTGQALALHNLGTNGFITRTGVGTVQARTITAGTGIVVVNGDGVSNDPIISAKTYAIGEFAHGGIVFWVDATGQHGLVCAKIDQSSTGIHWYAGTYGETQAKGDGTYAGKTNTAIIISSHVAIGDDGASYAARICNELQITENGINYGDWYLPAKWELNLIHSNISIINSSATSNGGNAISTTYYWSSTEIDSMSAWAFSFNSGSSYSIPKNASTVYVRAVRSF